MSEITVWLPLPDRALSPNARGHWAKKARAVKKAREVGYIATSYTMSDANGGRLRYRKNGFKWEAAETEAVFYVKDSRRRDADNAAASLKPYWDGMVDAGLLSDDRGLRHLPIKFVVDKKSQRVEVTIKRIV